MIAGISTVGVKVDGTTLGASVSSGQEDKKNETEISAGDEFFGHGIPHLLKRFAQAFCAAIFRDDLHFHDRK
jgi:hypothetical protein